MKAVSRAMTEAEKKGLAQLETQFPGHRVSIENGVAVLTPMEDARIIQRSTGLGKRASVMAQLEQSQQVA